MTDHVQLERQRLEDAVDRLSQVNLVLTIIARQAQRLIDDLHEHGATLSPAGETHYEALRNSLKEWARP